MSISREVTTLVKPLIQMAPKHKLISIKIRNNNLSPAENEKRISTRQTTIRALLKFLNKT